MNGGDNMIGYIYKIYNDINSKLYIGKTLDTLENRFHKHILDSTRSRCEKRPLYNAMNKYGVEHFYIELVEEVESFDLSEREKYWIAYYDSYSNGYNATRGGDGSQLYDYDLFVEDFLRGKTVKQIAEYYGCDCQPITNALRLAGIDSRINSIKNSSTPLRCLTLEGNFIKEFDSTMDAARWLKQNGFCKVTAQEKNIANAVSRVAKGERKTAYKMLWEYVV